MRKKEREELILKWAYEYARSGDFKDYSEIEWKLRNTDNCPEARTILDNYFIREELDELCKQAQKSKNE
ncbi:MAG: hypothetical protein H8E11_06410 [Candidatus Cloacimonetes bacterium]|nr:hypothetical protein [Candidatus Cloacimonadota bacterium]